MTILVPIAFAAGVITVFTPCILPVLPIVLAGGATGSKRRPYAVVAGLVATCTLFVLPGACVWSLLGIDAKYQNRIGAVLLGVLALTLIVPAAAALLERPLAFMTRWRPPALGGGFLLGVGLGLVFVPCGGLVLATIASIAARDHVGTETVFVTLFYALGAALPMLLIARGAHRATTAFRAHAQAIRFAAGVLMAAAAVVVYGGWLESWQTKVPNWIRPIQRAIEENGAAKRELARLDGRHRRSPFTVRAQGQPDLSAFSRPLKVSLNDYGPAPDFQRIAAWLNTPALDL